ncbi:hypothetical protein ACH4S8_37440 [Streptomyces sp. NPDC021080]|uniref:hypothetical protein n=1 Tax=Streptomyces sp. NPDC021080 TaxID=3365110 RepID=UPI0037A28873
MRRLTTTIAAALTTAAIAFSATGCLGDGSSSPSARTRESTSVSSDYDRLVTNQPAHTMKYSPTRDTKNFWIDTWGQSPGKLSYVYLQDSQGRWGYFILKGLPVTYCVSLVPPEKKVRADLGQYDGDAFVQSPSMDGTYSSSSNCTSYYGKDATSGAYVEWSVGANQSYLLYSEPMSLPQFKDATPLGKSTFATVKH